MKISVRSKGVRVTHALQDYIHRRVRFATDRFAGRIGRVEVHLQDVNGPKGGVDKICRMSAEMLGAGRIEVEERQPGLLVAIYHATRRMARSISRQADPRRDRASLRLA